VLDRRVSGESRGGLLRIFSAYGWCLDGGDRLRGVVLPVPWGGAMSALLPGATEFESAALLRGVRTLGASAGEVIVYTPVENTSTLALLQAEGFQSLRTVPRMAMGEPVAWMPSAVWNTFSLGFG
jgi:hypothetical protein